MERIAKSSRFSVEAGIGRCCEIVRKRPMAVRPSGPFGCVRIRSVEGLANTLSSRSAYPPKKSVLFFHFCGFAEEFHRNGFRFVSILLHFCSLLFNPCTVVVKFFATPTGFFIRFHSVLFGLAP